MIGIQYSFEVLFLDETVLISLLINILVLLEIDPVTFHPYFQLYSLIHFYF